MDNFELKSPIKKVNKVYGKRSLLSSSLPRIPTISSIISSSDSDSSDDENDVIVNVLNKGKEKEKVINTSSRTESTPSKLPSSSSSFNGTSTLGSTAAKLLLMKAKRSLTVVQQEEEKVIANGNLKKNVEGSLKIVVETEWDEVIDRASKSNKTVASTSKVPATASTITKSISPIKRNRILESSISSSPAHSLEDVSPKPSKRLKHEEVPIISHTLPSSAASTSTNKISPTQKQQQSKQQRTSRLSSPTQSSPSRATILNSRTSSPPKSPRSPNQPRSPTQAVASSSTSISKPVLLSPAKDLSSLFQQFTNATTSINSTSIGNGGGGGEKLVVAAMSGKTKGLISGLGSRSPSKLTPPQSPAQSLKKSSSFPSISNSPSATTTAQEFNSNSSLPVSLSTRPLIRANTTLGLSSSLTTQQPQQIPAATSTTFVPRGVGGATKRTYGAGGGRSFKRDEEEERVFGFPSLSSTSTPAKPSISMLNLKPYREKESYATLRTKWGVDYEEELDEANASQGEGIVANDLKSVMHLREKGENTRFGDEFNYLVEGLGKSMSLGVRRASAIEVLRKMLEVEFVRRLIASGFVERLFIDFRKAEAGDGTDRVLDSALAFLIILLVKDQRIAESLLCIPIASPSTSNKVQSDVLEVLTRNLNQTWASEEIAGLGSGNVTTSKGSSKGDLRSLASLRSVIDKSTFAQSGSFPITLRSLSLVAISTFASFTPRSIFRPQDLICSSGALDSVIVTFLHETEGIDLRISRYESGLELLPSDGSMNLNSIDTCLQIFESCSTSTPQTYDILSIKLTPLTSTLVSLILASHILAHDTNPTTTTNSEAMNVLLSSLRMLIDLTTNHEEWSRELMRGDNIEIVGSLVKIMVAARRRKGSVIEETTVVLSSDDISELGGEVDGKEKEASIMLRYDLLCLALGVLTNLVETVDTTKDILRETLIDLECKESRKCARKCQCLNRKTSIYRLTDLYLDPLDDSLNELNTSFINGYSGILLGLIMLDAPDNQLLVLEALSDHPKELLNLISAMEEFANLHDQASEKRGEETIEQQEEEEEDEAIQIEGAEMDLDLVIESEKKVVHVAVRIRSMLESLK